MTTATKKPAALLTTTLGQDGKLKHTLPAREQKKLQAAIDLCVKLGKVPALQNAAATACEALDKLMGEVGAEPK